MEKIALAVLLLVAATAPSYSSSYDELNVAISYFNQEQYDKAIVWFDKAVAAGDLIPDLQRVALLDRAAAHGARGDIPKAITDYSAAIALQPNETLAYRQRIRAYLANNDPEKAWADYETLRKLRPLDRDLARDHGWLSWRLNKLESSAEAFNQFSKVDFASWLWLQLANARLGRPVSAPLPLNERAARDWPLNLVLFFQGEMSDTEILATAKTKDESGLCTGQMYVGLWRALHGDAVRAEALLQAAVSGSCEKGRFSDIVRAELNKLAAGTKTQ